MRRHSTSTLRIFGRRRQLGRYVAGMRQYTTLYNPEWTRGVRDYPGENRVDENRVARHRHRRGSRHNGSRHSERRRQRQTGRADTTGAGTVKSGGSGRAAHRRADTTGAGTVKGGGSGRAAHLCKYMYVSSTSPYCIRACQIRIGIPSYH